MVEDWWQTEVRRDLLGELFDAIWRLIGDRSDSEKMHWQNYRNCMVIGGALKGTMIMDKRAGDGGQWAIEQLSMNTSSFWSWRQTAQLDGIHIMCGFISLDESWNWHFAMTDDVINVCNSTQLSWLTTHCVITYNINVEICNCMLISSAWLFSHFIPVPL